jgi:hypothetical protein
MFIAAPVTERRDGRLVAHDVGSKWSGVARGFEAA